LLEVVLLLSSSVIVLNGPMLLISTRVEFELDVVDRL
jgi:hypothetical protein